MLFEGNGVVSTQSSAHRFSVNFCIWLSMNILAFLCRRFSTEWKIIWLLHRYSIWIKFSFLMEINRKIVAWYNFYLHYLLINCAHISHKIPRSNFRIKAALSFESNEAEDATYRIGRKEKTERERERIIVVIYQ